MKNTVTVATCCYDKDWKVVLSPDYLSKQFANFDYEFDEKLLIINTVNERDEITERAALLCASGDIDAFYFTDDFKSQFFEKFKVADFKYKHKLNLFKNNSGNNPIAILKKLYHFYIKKKGQYKFTSLTEKEFDCSAYALGPLCAILNAKSDFLLYFTEDCSFQKNQSDWINSGITMLNANNEYLSARPIDDDLDSNYIDIYPKLDEFYICHMFTDRMFLANTSSLSNVDFNSEDSGKYPPYGGAGFEAKVFNYMNQNNKKILISQNCKYIHEYDEYMNKVFGTK